MKRFAVLFNQSLNRIFLIDFISEEFDKYLCDLNNLDLEVLNEYEAIYMYFTPGANPHLFEEQVGKFVDRIPIWLRKNGVVKPKFLFQMDYFCGRTDIYPFEHNLPYVDLILDVVDRKYKNTDKTFYVAFPLRISLCGKPIKQYSFHEKEDYIAGLKRFYGRPSPMLKLISRIGLRPSIIGVNEGKKYGEDYFEWLGRAKLVLDYHTAGLTWSRLGAESAFCFTPIMGHSDYKSIYIANKDLAIDYTEENMKQILDMANKLLTDKEYYYECQVKAYRNIAEHISVEKCTERFKNALRLVGIDVS